MLFNQLSPYVTINASTNSAWRLKLHFFYVAAKIWLVLVILFTNNLSYAAEIDLNKPLPPQLATKAKDVGLNVPLVLALVETGSGFDVDYVGSDGRLGLFALDAALMRRHYQLSAKQLLDAERATMAALRYLQGLEILYATSGEAKPEKMAAHYLTMRPVASPLHSYQQLEHEVWLYASPAQLNRVKTAYQRWKKVYPLKVSPGITQMSQPQRLTPAVTSERNGCPRVLDDFMDPNSSLYHAAGHGDFTSRAFSRTAPKAEQVLDDWSPCW